MPRLQLDSHLSRLSYSGLALGLARAESRYASRVLAPRTSGVAVGVPLGTLATLAGRGRLTPRALRLYAQAAARSARARSAQTHTAQSAHTHVYVRLVVKTRLG